jgi:hypothetical protein
MRKITKTLFCFKSGIGIRNCLRFFFLWIKPKRMGKTEKSNGDVYARVNEGSLLKGHLRLGHFIGHLATDPSSLLRLGLRFCHLDCSHSESAAVFAERRRLAVVKTREVDR